MLLDDFGWVGIACVFWSFLFLIVVWCCLLFGCYNVVFVVGLDFVLFTLGFVLGFVEHLKCWCGFGW